MSTAKLATARSGDPTATVLLVALDFSRLMALRESAFFTILDTIIVSEKCRVLRVEIKTSGDSAKKLRCLEKTNPVK